MADSERFDRAAASWDEDPRRVLQAHGVAEAIARRIPLSRDLDVFDFGCGTGLLALFLQPLVRTVTGADTSAGMLEALRHKVRERKLDNVDTVLLPPGTALSLPGRYHLVVSSMALHHVAELAPLFRSFHAHLHPGGQVGLADLDREDGSFHSDRNLAQHPGFERREIELLLGDAGFVEVEVATATVTRKNERDYPIFLATGRRPG